MLMNERAHGLTEARPLLTPIEEVTKQTADALGKMYEEVSEPDYVQEEQERRAKLSPLERAVDNATFIVDKIHPQVSELFRRADIGELPIAPKTILDLILYRRVIDYTGQPSNLLGFGVDYVSKMQSYWDTDSYGSRKTFSAFGDLPKGEIVLKFINHLAEELK